MTTSFTSSPSPYAHRYQFPPASLEFHYRLGTHIRSKWWRIRLWFYRRSRRALFASIMTSPMLPAIPVTPKPPVPPNLTATIWPSVGGQITQPLRNPLMHIETQEEETASMANIPHPRERITQPLVLENFPTGTYSRIWTQEFHSGKHPAVCTEAALGTLAKQRPFPDVPEWHPAHPEATLKRIRLVKPPVEMRKAPKPGEIFPEYDWIH